MPICSSRIGSSYYAVDIYIYHHYLRLIRSSINLNPLINTQKMSRHRGVRGMVDEYYDEEEELSDEDDYYSDDDGDAEEVEGTTTKSVAVTASVMTALSPDTKTEVKQQFVLPFALKSLSLPVTAETKAPPLISLRQTAQAATKPAVQKKEEVEQSGSLFARMIVNAAAVTATAEQTKFSIYDSVVRDDDFQFDGESHEDQVKFARAKLAGVTIKPAKSQQVNKGKAVKVTVKPTQSSSTLPPI